MTIPTPIPPPTCRGTTKAGAPCRVTLNLSETGYCIQHDPARHEQRKALWRAGGLASAPAQRLAKAALPEGVPKAPKTIEDAERFASWLTYAVAVGDISPKVAHEVAVALKEFRGAAEKRALEKELKALRLELAAAKAKTPRST